MPPWGARRPVVGCRGLRRRVGLGVGQMSLSGVRLPLPPPIEGLWPRSRHGPLRLAHSSACTPVLLDPSFSTHSVPESGLLTPPGTPPYQELSLTVIRHHLHNSSFTCPSNPDSRPVGTSVSSPTRSDLTTDPTPSNSFFPTSVSSSRTTTKRWWGTLWTESLLQDDIALHTPGVLVSWCVFHEVRLVSWTPFLPQSMCCQFLK